MKNYEASKIVWFSFQPSTVSLQPFQQCLLEVCPNCGESLPRTAKSCPECGSDDKTGWSDKAGADNLGLPDEEFNYDEFVKDEFGSGLARPRSLHWLWWVTALLLIVLFLLFCLH